MWRQVGQAAASGPADRTWSVAELGQELRRLVSQAYRGEIWVRGEIRNLPADRRHRSHLYFTLVEPGPAHQRAEAALDVVLFATDRAAVNQSLNRAGRVLKMDDGVQVRIRGRLDWWAPAGRLQLAMTGIDPAYTLGQLAEQRAATLAALAEEGLLDRNRRIATAPLPLRIGLVTARDSAAHADVRRELAASGYGFTVVEVDARTQGPTAPDSLVSALTAVQRRGVDVVILARGGGAKTDLAAFDHPQVARAVASAGVPVVSGIGHEIDRSVVDEVAHTSCKTPTAAAAWVVARVTDAADRLDAADRRLAATTRANLDRERARLARAAAAVAARSHTTVALAGQALVSGRSRLQLATTRALAESSRRLDDAAARVRMSDPHRLLERGWAITRDRNGRTVRRAADVAVGSVLVTTLVDVAVTSRVEQVQAGEPSVDG